MLVNTELLSSYGGITETYYPKDIIFEEGQTPKYYHQIISGTVKLNHMDEDAKELIQSILTIGDSVCELLLFIEEKYPVNAIAISECEIMKLPKADFLEMLDDNRQASLEVRRFVSQRLYQKFIMMQNNASPYAEIRIKGMLNYFKSLSSNQTLYSYEFPLSRQQLASITGLRVETTIRCVKKMESEKLLKIINRKIFC
jgi:CRP-like cAMP-binding protein